MSSLDKNEVHYPFWSDISTGEYIFVSFTSYYSSFDAHLHFIYHISTYLPLNAYFQGTQSSNQLQIIVHSKEISKSQMAANHGR